MVGEFPELQGVMGRYYALDQKERPAVADAIAAHYKPLGPSDDVPREPVAIAVALADKLDMLVGFWAIDEKPTGARTLTRSAAPRSASSASCWRTACGCAYWVCCIRSNSSPRPGIDWGGRQVSKENLDSNFFADRLKVHLRDQGARHDLVDAVFALGGDDLLMIVKRVEALGNFLDTEDGENLLTGTKRAINILRIEEKKDGVTYDQAARSQPAQTNRGKGPRQSRRRGGEGRRCSRCPRGFRGGHGGDGEAPRAGR